MDSIILLCGAVLAVRNDNPVSDIGVRYEETSFPLNEFPVEYVNDISYYAITELLEAGEPQKITVFNYSTNKIQASISVIKFYNIEITYDKAVYYDCDSSGTVRFHTDRYYLQTCFSIFDDEVSIPIRDGAILLNPPIFKWKIDNGECNCQFDEHGIWYKSFADSSILEIECSGEHSFDVYLTNNCVQSEKRGKNVFKLRSRNV